MTCSPTLICKQGAIAAARSRIPTCECPERCSGSSVHSTTYNPGHISPRSQKFLERLRCRCGSSRLNEPLETNLSFRGACRQQARRFQNNQFMRLASPSTRPVSQHMRAVSSVRDTRLRVRIWALTWAWTLGVCKASGKESAHELRTTLNGVPLRETFPGEG